MRATIIKQPLGGSSQQSQDKKWSGQGVVPPRYTMKYLAEFLEYNVWHRRCCALKTNVCVGLGIEIVTDDEDKEPDEEYRRLEDLLDAQQLNSRGVDIEETIRRIVFDFFAVGNGFVEAIRRGNGELDELVHAPAYTMRVAEKGGYRQIRSNNKAVAFADFGEKDRSGINEIAHILQYDPLSDFYGLPDWFPAYLTIVLDREQSSYNVKSFQNELLAKVILFFKNLKIGKEARKTLESFFSEKGTGIENAGRALILDSEGDEFGNNVELEMHKIQSDTKEGAFNQSRKLNRDEVVGAWGVPPRLVGILSSGQLGGGGEGDSQMKIFKETEIDPLQRKFEKFFNHILRTGLDLKKWKLKFKEFDYTSAFDDAEYLNQIAPYLTDDERREVIGYKPIENKGSVEKTKITSLAKALVELRRELEE